MRTSPTAAESQDANVYVSFASVDCRRSKCSEDGSKRKPDEPRLTPRAETLTCGDYLRHFLAFRKMAIPYFRETMSGRCLLTIIVLLLLLKSGVRVIFSYIIRDFWTALSSKDQDEFYFILRKFLVALLLLAPVNVFFRYQRVKLAIEWREWMTNRVLQLYYTNRVYYALERGGEIDNPDQRITEDVKSFTGYSLTFLLTLISSSIDLVCFSFILYSIRPQLFLAIVIFAAFGTACTILIGKRLVGLNFANQEKEADFRFSLVRTREYAESIAFYAGEDIENKEIGIRLGRVIENMHEINLVNRNLDMFTTIYDHLVWVLPLVVVAPEYFSGNVEMGVVSQSSSAFGHVLSDLLIIMDNFESLSAFAAGVDRLHQFLKEVRTAYPDLDENSCLLSLPRKGCTEDRASIFKGCCSTADTIDLWEMPPVSSELKESTKIPYSALTMRQLHLHTPDRKRVLIKNLQFSLPWGENLLIAGPSGAGKSSLLRAIAGLWTSGSGSIDRPNDRDVCFLPQRPYCPLGSLRDQLLYPSTIEMKPGDHPEGHRLSRASLMRKCFSDEHLLKILHKVNLPNLAQTIGDGDPFRGLNTVLDWNNFLSLGEQQRLAFGRIFVNEPHLVIMDESTSALDIPTENQLYLLLRTMSKRRSFTYISVGHRPSLQAHHHLILHLKDGGHFSVEPIGPPVAFDNQTVAS